MKFEITYSESIERLKQFTFDLNKEPLPEHIKKNDDGSLYIPISITQSLLDDIFLGRWNFEITSSTYGRKWARGSGYMDCVNPITGEKIRRSGDAGILLTGNVRTDSPRLEAMVLLSCARKFGKVLGRDLNRFKDDAPLPVVKVDKSPDKDTEQQRLLDMINDCTTEEEINSYKILSKQRGVEKEWTKKYKLLTQK
jgi:hypothetical protein